MKSISIFGFAVLMAALPLGAQAVQGKPGSANDRTWSGTVTAVSAQDKTFAARRGLLTRTFKVGEQCPISTVDKKEATLSDLRVGERIGVHYQDVEGVWVARRVTERARHWAGTVHSIDQKSATVTMEEAPLYQPFHAPRTFRLAGDCKVVLWNGHEGSLRDIQPGDRVAVIYDLPAGAPTAYRIRDSSVAAVGTLEAIDLPARTVKAKESSGEKQFVLADDCRIILSGNQKGRWKDLVAGQKYKFTYEDVNGVEVLDRIAPAQAGTTAQTASTL